MAHVLIFVNDLFFADRLANGLTGAGHTGRVVDLSLETAPPLTEEVDLVVVDLEAGGEALSLIQAARAAAKPVLAFGPHTDADLRLQAIAAGATRVVPKSKLTTAFAELIAAMTSA